MHSKTPNLLLHICCGPCAITTSAAVLGAGFAATGLFYNPNIHPAQEYLKRRQGALEVAGRQGLDLRFCREEYEPRVFLRAVHGREGEERCRVCYALRLMRAAQAARANGFTHFCTSLLYSRRQRHEEIVEAAKAAEKQSGVEFYYQDLRPTWQAGIERSKEWGIYRQNYCGCIYSEQDRFARELAAAQANAPLLETD